LEEYRSAIDWKFATAAWSRSRVSQWVPLMAGATRTICATRRPRKLEIQTSGGNATRFSALSQKSFEDNGQLSTVWDVSKRIITDTGTVPDACPSSATEQTPLQTLSASHNAWRSVSTQWLRAASLRPTRDWSPLMHGCRRQGSQNAVTRRWPMASPALSSATLRRCRRGPGFRARFVLVADINAHLQSLAD